MSIGTLRHMSQEVDPVAACIARERELLQRPTRCSQDTLERLLDPDFEEIGASGKAWSRQAIIEELSGDRTPSDSEPPIGAEDMTGRLLADDLVLLTYVSDASGRRARRSSLWRCSGGSWRLFFHQGTPLS
jgi:hypothetical protein